MNESELKGRVPILLEQVQIECKLILTQMY